MNSVVANIGNIEVNQPRVFKLFWSIPGKCVKQVFRARLDSEVVW